MKRIKIKFIQDILSLSANYDSDGNGMCGEDFEEVVNILKRDYPTLFKAYIMLED